MTDKLSFKLDQYEGPLDLLLNLLREHKLNIYDIPVAELCDQYMLYIQQMQDMDMELCSEFLEMAARLVYLKSASLLPNEDEEVEQLKAELTGQLLEYELCRKIAGQLKESAGGFNFFVRQPAPIPPEKAYKHLHDRNELLAALLAAAGRGQRFLPPPTESFERIVAKKIVSVSGRIVFVLRTLWRRNTCRFHDLFAGADSKSEMVATFLAVLELVKARRISLSGHTADLQLSAIKERQKSS